MQHCNRVLLQFTLCSWSAIAIDDKGNVFHQDSHPSMVFASFDGKKLEVLVKFGKTGETDFCHVSKSFYDFNLQRNCRDTVL